VKNMKRDKIIRRLNMVGCVLSLNDMSDEELQEQYEHYKKWTNSIGTFTRYTGLEKVGEFYHISDGEEPPKFGGETTYEKMC